MATHLPNLLCRGTFFRTEKMKPFAIAISFALFSSALTSAAVAQEVDADAAATLARQNGCLKCHAVDKVKDAPAYKSIAAKYKGQPDAENKLLRHITTSPKVKFEDGHEEEHKVIKTKDEARQRNLVRWILSL